ncbi:hypothetical protein [Crenobacter cavernae]|uniref:Uncharacterized protein n=1 Tax=Crenobacter cavernae TaxID=2290923 RepID=A0A345Y2N4_9NEIS|nr:hypothetical protein [Crenobacter cavernae]AXK38186.1 hypothetical protein DWG20_01360 [Crenobacter cavernae]
MEIAALGHAPHLDWIRRRLVARGFVLAGVGAAMLPGQPDWQGLAAPGLLVDLGQPTLANARYRAELAHAVPAAYVELAGAWHPLGEQYGFMLIAAGDDDALCVACPVLDALAPLPGAWLNAGPAGAAGFVHSYLDRLTRACLAAWPHDAQSQPDCPGLFDSQRALTEELVALSDAYWQSLGEAAEPDANLVSEFALPLPLQRHYARTLAGVTLYAFGQHGLFNELLERLWQQQAPAAPR